MSTPDVSVVIPVSKRSDDLARILDELRKGLSGTGKSYEIVMVVDGGLPERLEEARKAAETAADIRILRFARRFGEGAALQAGLAASRAPVILTHPAYLEVQLEVLPRLIAAVDGDADLAFASRLPRKETLFNRLQRWCFNALVRVTLGTPYRDIAGSVRVVKRSVIEEISTHGAFHRFITAAAVMSGFVAEEIEAPVHPEAARSRVHSPFTYLHRLLDIANVFFVTKFLYKPLRFFGSIGSMLFLPGFLICLYLSIMKVFTGIPLGDRPLFLFGVILTVLGFQIVAIGLLGEIISFAFATRKKPYAVRTVVRKKPDASTPTPSKAKSR